MPITVSANKLSVVHKASSGVTIAFPDVCKTPGASGPPPGGIPLPYPNVAQTAIAKQQAKVPGGLKPMASGSQIVGTAGGEAGTSKNVGSAEFHTSGFNVKAEGKAVMGFDMHVHNRQNEASQLRATLDELHRQMRGLSPGNPDKWQAVMQNYAVAASALYVTITDDD